MKIYLATFFIFCSSFIHSYSQDVFCTKIEKLINVAQKHHLKSIAIDSEFQILVEDLFFENLDPYQLLFTAQDLRELKHAHDLPGRYCDWIEKVDVRLSSNMGMINDILSDLGKQELNFEANEKFAMPKNSNGVDKDGFKNHWRRYLKFRMLNELDTTQVLNPKLDQFKVQILENLNCRIKKLSVNENALEDLYLQCISSAFDPHSFYLPANQANLFLEELKGNNKSYGLVLSSKNDHIIVDKVIPGSSAWNSNAINEGDVILQLETSEGKTFDFSCLSYQECQEILLRQNGKINLEIRKASKKLEQVSITKEVLSESDENIQSFILKKENKVAYIYLPSFYSGEENNFYQPTGCAKDLAKEIIKLKRENVEALILDLRNNGGGSMFEALHMAGLFIDYGSLIILEDRHEEPEVIKDVNRGLVFNKPLIVLINNLSASASEMLAGVLQDYNRALIVGSRSFGKSSAQVFYDLDGNLFDGVYDTKKDLVKLTTGLFYRVSSASHQKVGITPNVVLPELFEKMNPKESDFPNALDNKISSKKTSFKALSETGFEALEIHWNTKVENDEYFSKIRSVATSTIQDQIENGFSLSLNDYIDYIKTKQKLIEEIDLGTPNYFEEVTLPTYRQSTISDNSFAKTEHEKKLKDIGKDPYIVYSFKIIQDMIKHKN